MDAAEVKKVLECIQELSQSLANRMDCLTHRIGRINRVAESMVDKLPYMSPWTRMPRNRHDDFYRR